MSGNVKNIVLNQGEGKSIEVPGHTVTHKMRGEDTGGVYALLEVELHGDGPPQHIHNNEEEAFYVLEGEINMLMGERTMRMKAGSFVLILRGTVHAMCLVDEKPAKFLAMFSPPGLEGFFDEAAGLDLSDTNAYIAKANELAEKYHMEIVGPPIKP